MKTNTGRLKAPYPYFGGKRAVADLVWDRFGDVANYVEPFFGSGAVLLGRPHKPRIETVNDLDAMICNFWRAVQYAPDEVAHHADWPVNENDLHARHAQLIERKEEISDIIQDPKAYDAEVAGWWVWGICQWIGSGWCWKRTRQLSCLSEGERGIIKRPAIANNGRGIHSPTTDVGRLLSALAERLRLVRVCCGDWKRVCTPAVTTGVHPDTAVFLDPPYGVGDRAEVYDNDSRDVSQECLKWCQENEKNIKIAVCGYDGEYNVLEDSNWEVVFWKASGGFGNQRKNGSNDNAGRERIWFSPRCRQLSRLF